VSFIEAFVRGTRDTKHVLVSVPMLSVSWMLFELGVSIKIIFFDVENVKLRYVFCLLSLGT